MPLYELGIIVDPEVAPDEETAALERLETIITDNGGTMVDKDARGRRQLAYPIRKRNYGVYHFWQFEVDGDALEKLNFELRTNDVIMRSLTLNLDRELKRKRKLDKKRDEKAAKKAAKRAAAAEAEAGADAAADAS
jgi:small subunit ribosomal protein S6